MADMHAAIAAKLDELERIAKAATPGPWRMNVYGIEFEVWSEEEHRAVAHRLDTVQGANSRSDTLAIATFADPAAVLCGLAEDRDILTRHCTDAMTPGPPVCGACSWWEPGAGVEPMMAVPSPCPEIRSLAARHSIEVPS